jgi:hypothetical protein
MIQTPKSLRVLACLLALGIGFIAGAIVDILLGTGYNDLEMMGAGLIIYHILACAYFIRYDRLRAEKFKKMIEQMGATIVNVEPGEDVKSAINKAEWKKKRENKDEE